MATLKQRLHRKNSSGSYDIIHMETSSDLVKRPDGTTVEDALGNIPSVTNLYTKSETLSESTKAAYGLDTSVVPNDIFKNIATRFDLLKTGKSWISVKVKDTSGNPVTQVKVAGITDGDGGSVYTDENGVAEGYSESGTVTLSVSGYADVEDISKSITVGSGEIMFVEIVATRRNFVKITSSTNVQFSGEVETVDVTVVGGGGGGGGASGSSWSGRTPGGGGGGYCKVKENISVLPKVLYPASIGAGGTAGPGSNGGSTSGTGGNGGTTTFLDISASGGSGGSYENTGGAGNGSGGNANTDSTNITNGVDGSVLGYSSYTEMVRYGGGGGGGIFYNWSNQPTVTDPGYPNNGGKDFGGSGGTAKYDRLNYGDIGVAAFAGLQGTDGCGGGGGGGCCCVGNYQGRVRASSGGKGGSGCVAMRIHFKEAA